MRGAQLHAREVHGTVNLRSIVFRGHDPTGSGHPALGLPVGLAPVKWLTNAIKIIAVSGCSPVDVAFQHTHLPHQVLTHGL